MKTDSGRECATLLRRLDRKSEFSADGSMPRMALKAPCEQEVRSSDVMKEKGTHEDHQVAQRNWGYKGDVFPFKKSGILDDHRIKTLIRG